MAGPKEGESHEEGERWLERRLQRLANEENFIGVEVAMGGRRIQVPRAGGGVALFRFDEVCASAMGAGDYTAVASTFHTVGLSRVPRMTIERVDLMRRFITFIDVMYEHKVKLLACAPTSPATLFVSSGGKGQRDEEFAWDRAASTSSGDVDAGVRGGAVASQERGVAPGAGARHRGGSPPTSCAACGRGTMRTTTASSTSRSSRNSSRISTRCDAGTGTCRRSSWTARGKC